jgi:hypothetical protein
MIRRWASPPSVYCECIECFDKYKHQLEDVTPTGFDTFWDEPYAMDIEFVMLFRHLGQWLSVQIR